MTVATTRGRVAEPTTAAERRMHQALVGTDAVLEERFLRHLARARGAILRRLVMGLWREDVAGLRSASHRVAGWIVHELGSGTTVAFPVRAERAFDRIDPGQPILRLGAATAGGAEVVQSPVDLAAMMSGREPAPRWDALAEELDDSVANLALAYARADLRPPREFEDPLLHFERLNTEGHNLHPCARTRLGMTSRDVLRYDLESDEPTELVVVGVRRDRVESAVDESGRDVGEILRAAYPAIDHAVRQHVRNPDEYVFLPVHPWQLDAAIRPQFCDDIAEGAVVVVPAAGLRAVPTASLRTLLAAPSATGERLFVKTSIDVQITSTRRTISAHTTNNGPPYSRMIRRIVASEPSLADRVVALDELAGASYRSAEERRVRALSALVRSGPLLETGEVPVPASSLTARSPHTGNSVLVDLVESRGGGSETALDWLEDYAYLFLRPVVTMMTKYGVGLEAHLQNCVPTFIGGKPHRLLLRDWGGVRIYPPRLERHGVRVGRRLGALTVTTDVDAMRARALSTSLPNHLDEIVGHLVAQWGAAEDDAWARVRQVLDKILAELERQPELRGDVGADRAALFAPRMPVKALVRMRLWPSRGDQYVHAPNPLRS